MSNQTTEYYSREVVPIVCYVAISFRRADQKARQHAIDSARRDLHLNVSGCSVEHGSFSTKLQKCELHGR